MATASIIQFDAEVLMFCNFLTCFVGAQLKTDHLCSLNFDQAFLHQN
jgi:hypothetical protein